MWYAYLEIYKFRFEFSWLRSEHQVLYSRSDLRKNSIEELHRYMHENDLYGGFKEMHKLVILVLTIFNGISGAFIFYTEKGKDVFREMLRAKSESLISIEKYDVQFRSIL